MTTATTTAPFVFVVVTSVDHRDCTITVLRQVHRAGTPTVWTLIADSDGKDTLIGPDAAVIDLSSRYGRLDDTAVADHVVEQLQLALTAYYA